MDKVKILAVDIDGTLTKEVCWTEEECLNAEPRIKVIEKLRKIFSKHFVVILTARKIELATPTLIWLKKYNIPHNAVSFDKMAADWYIDDKCTNVEDWLKETEEV